MGHKLSKTRANRIARLARLWRDKRGAFAMQFALMLIPLVLCVGLAIDGGRVFLARFNLASALDAAALAMGSMTDDSVDLNAMAEVYVAQNFRMPDTGTVALTSTPETITPSTEDITLRGTVAVNTYFMPLAGISTVNVSAESVVKRGGADVEVALVLDTTGSMSGTRMTNLKSAANSLVSIVVNPVQTPWYSKVALVPYANSVYLGANADAVRGAPPEGADIIAGVVPPSLSPIMNDASKAKKARIYADDHGLSNNDIIRIDGVLGMTQLNGGIYKVKNAKTNNFRIKYEGGPNHNKWVNSKSWSSYIAGGIITPLSGGGCADPCLAILTAPNHGFSNNDWIRIEGASGWGEMNNSGDSAWQIENVTTNTFTLKNSDASDWGVYIGGAKAFCTTPGCKYLRYTADNGSTRVKQLSQCVTERVGSEQYTNASYATKGVGYHYPSGGGNLACSTDNPITPLTANSSTLTTDINDLTTGGSTAGHIGLAWGYYALSPSFSPLWPDSSQHPGAIGAQDLVKALILMTDGEFNTGYCNGVIAADSGYGGSSSHINCDAENGGAYAQATQLCNSIKSDGIILYTVGFEMTAGSTGANFLEGCATAPENYYLASNGAELTAAFNSIAKSISLLRLAK